MIDPPTKNIVWHSPTITRDCRQQLNQHQAAILWFTGLPSSGKSTLAHALEAELYRRGCHTYVLDGDNIRHGLNADLGFSWQDRRENIRRIGEVSKLLMDSGCIVLSAFISPSIAERQKVRDLFEPIDFFEIYCQASVKTCEKRDPKGLYQKARLGQIQHFTGVSSVYEAPLNPEIILNTEQLSITDCVDLIIKQLIFCKIIK